MLGAREDEESGPGDAQGPLCAVRLDGAGKDPGGFGEQVRPRRDLAEPFDRLGVRDLPVDAVEGLALERGDCDLITGGHETRVRCAERSSIMVEPCDNCRMSDPWDGLIGGLGGGLLVGVAQMCTYALDKRANRRDIERQVIPDLLNDLDFVEVELATLWITEAQAGSTNAERERMKNARPLLDRLREASAVRVPLVRDASLRGEFAVLRELCVALGGTSIDPFGVRDAAKLTSGYLGEVRASLVAVYHGEKSPARPAKPDLPTRSRSGTLAERAEMP